MSSLIEMYSSKLETIGKEKRDAEDLYEDAVMKYIASEAAHAVIKDCWKSVFIPAVIYLTQKNDLVAYQSNGRDWHHTPEKVKELFGLYGEAIIRLFDYLWESIDDSNSGLDFFAFSIWPFDNVRIPIVDETTSYLDEYRYEDESRITRYGKHAKDNFEKVLKENMREIMFESLSKDPEIMSLMTYDSDFTSLLLHEHGVDLQEYVGGIKKLPEQVNTIDYNLWDIYAQYVSAT